MLRTVCLVALLSMAVLAAKKSPNDKLKQCCNSLKGADKECVEKFCDFNAISQANILNYLSTCQERPNTVGPMWDCASTRHDHSECCKAKGVNKDCMPYCAAQEGVPTNYLDYLFCTEDFNAIRECFMEHLEKAPAFKKH